jgi:hypothetical protein
MIFLFCALVAFMDIKALTIFFPAHALKQVSVINSRTVLKDQILVQNDR